MRRRTNITVAALLGVTIGTVACGGNSAPPPVAADTAPAVVQLAPENVATAALADLTSGPFVSGQLTPAREATVRAQTGEIGRAHV